MTGKFPPRTWHLDSRLVHVGLGSDPTTGAVAPPIHMSTTFARGEDGALIGDHLYGRQGNPNRDALELCLADLEGGAEAASFASGCAAAQTLFGTLCHGDRVVVGDDMYFGIRSLLDQLAARIGVTVTTVDLRDGEATEAALGPDVAFAMAESPTNPRMNVVDLASVARACERHGVPLVVDNTMATPLVQQPLSLGATLVLHSTTKYLSGHGDLLGGALVVADATHARWSAIRALQQVGGAVPSPFDAWLLRRSICTLGLRVNRQIDNAEGLAPQLAAHPAVLEVAYPGLPSHPDHTVAAKQMARPGAMLALRVKGGFEGARRFVASLELATVATSLGAVHTLVEHRAPVEGPNTRTPDDLVRVSVGIEALEDLTRDFEHALDAIP